jgi:hypothetical protein
MFSKLSLLHLLLKELLEVFYQQIKRSQKKLPKFRSAKKPTIKFSSWHPSETNYVYGLTQYKQKHF